MTFTTGTFNAVYKYEKVLDAGEGCFMHMNRMVNGSWGELHIEVDNIADQKNLVIFDDEITGDDHPRFTPFENSLESYVVGLPYRDDGWGEKKIFIVNKDLFRSAQFTYTYNGASYLNLYQGLVAALSLLTIYINA